MSYEEEDACSRTAMRDIEMMARDRIWKTEAKKTKPAAMRNIEMMARDRFPNSSGA
jgi:hypothetical protein